MTPDCLLLQRHSTRLLVALEQQRCGVEKMKGEMWVGCKEGGSVSVCRLQRG